MKIISQACWQNERPPRNKKHITENIDNHIQTRDFEHSFQLQNQQLKA